MLFNQKQHFDNSGLILFIYFTQSLLFFFFMFLYFSHGSSLRFPVAVPTF